MLFKISPLYLPLKKWGGGEGCVPRLVLHFALYNACYALQYSYIILQAILLFQNLSEEAALKVLLDVLEAVKCKVCKFVISLPLVSDIDGDIVCETCLTTDSKFPHLAGAKPLSPTEESILTSVVLAIPRECRYTGCPLVIVPGDDHKVWCEYQETSCKLCDWVGAARDIVYHAKTSHQLDPHEMGEFVVRRQLEQFCPNNEVNSFTAVFVGNVFLWVVTSVDTYEKEFRNNYISVPMGRQATKISVEIVFGSECLKNVNSIKKELNLNPVFSTSTRNSIVFPTSVLDDYIDQNNVLQWSEVFTAEVL